MGSQNRIAQAREAAGISAKDFAEMLHVAATTVSNWETGHRQLSLERLLQIAQLLNVSVSYLLGAEEQPQNMKQISKDILLTLHWTPVWVRNYGWALVNANDEVLVFADKSSIPIHGIKGPFYIIPPAFSLGLHGVGEPLDLDDIIRLESIWVEPITADPDLAAELRGWYRPRRKLVENEFGNRFYLDTYGTKWLAFETCLE